MSDEEDVVELDDEAKDALQNGELENEHDDEDYGERVRKRINKEVSKRKALAEERDRLAAEREQIQRERDEARARLAKYEERQDEDLKAKVDDIKARRDKALDEGDLAEYNKLNDELLDARIELRDRSTRRPAPREDNDDRQPAAIPKASSAWVERNRDWLMADPANQELAKSIEQKLVRKHGGYTDELYRELSKRLASVSDDYVYDDVAEDDFEEPAPRGNTAGVPRDSYDEPTSQRRSGKLTRADLAAMAKFGMDPNSPKDRKAWINRNAEL